MSREIQQSNKAPRHHNDNFESDKRFIETVAELRSMKILSRIEGDEEKVKAELLASLKEVVSKMLPENMRDSSVSLAKLDEMEKKLSSGYTSFWS